MSINRYVFFSVLMLQAVVFAKAGTQLDLDCEQIELQPTHYTMRIRSTGQDSNYNVRVSSNDYGFILNYDFVARLQGSELVGDGIRVSSISMNRQGQATLTVKTKKSPTTRMICEVAHDKK